MALKYSITYAKMQLHCVPLSLWERGGDLSVSGVRAL